MDQITYGARASFDRRFPEDWESYTSFSRLHHCQEIISLDNLLNKSLVRPDYENAQDWSFFVDGPETHDGYNMQTDFYTTVDYVLQRMINVPVFNLLAGVILPGKECRDREVKDFEFIGYDLIDEYFTISALTNCGGFDDIFLPKDQNQYGLIDTLDKANKIRQELLEKYPDEPHAVTHVVALWRHQIIGRPD